MRTVCHNREDVLQDDRVICLVEALCCGIMLSDALQHLVEYA